MFGYLAKTTPILFTTLLITGIHSNPASAQTEPNQIINQIQEYTQEGKEDSINQITNVNQLKDVSPTDWSYEALRGLSDRYGCISGLPDGTYQGDRPITRNEFAAGLNSCFQQIERSISDYNSQLEGLDAIIPHRTFIQELEAAINQDDYLNERVSVNKSESRTIQLEENYFSPTIKLTGETIFDVSNQF